MKLKKFYIFKTYWAKRNQSRLDHFFLQWSKQIKIFD